VSDVLANNYLEANSIPIALISETHLKPSLKFKCPSYITYRSERVNQHGGGHFPSSCLLFKRLVRTSEETHYELSIGLFVPHRKHIMSCL
jgi:hypothetical protein